MPIRYNKFIFTSYTFKPKQKRLTFSYRITFANKEALDFTEELILSRIPTLQHVPRKLLESVFESLHLVLGISYYKLYCPGKVEVPYKLTKQQASFWTTVYRKGLGEFFFGRLVKPFVGFDALGWRSVCGKIW